MGLMYHLRTGEHHSTGHDRATQTTKRGSLQACIRLCFARKWSPRFNCQKRTADSAELCSSGRPESQPLTAPPCTSTEDAKSDQAEISVLQNTTAASQAVPEEQAQQESQIGMSNGMLGIVGGIFQASPDVRL